MTLVAKKYSFYKYQIAIYIYTYIFFFQIIIIKATYIAMHFADI